MGSKKKTGVVTSDPLALIVEKTKVSKSKEKVVVSSDSKGNQEINGNMVFMDQIEKVLSDSEASSSSANEKISELDRGEPVIISDIVPDHLISAWNRRIL
nr:hypothetical protein [Tanacetum cinerariifolium]